MRQLLLMSWVLVVLCVALVGCRAADPSFKADQSGHLRTQASPDEPSLPRGRHIAIATSNWSTSVNVFAVDTPDGTLYVVVGYESTAAVLAQRSKAAERGVTP